MKNRGYQRLCLSVLLLFLLAVIGSMATPASARTVQEPVLDKKLYLPIILKPEDVPANMVLVPAGEFEMGCSSGCTNSDQSPQHTVTLDAYYIDKYEVTNAMYFECVDDAVCHAPADSTAYADPAYANHPVTWVNWYWAKDYCTYMGKRLPSEAEWEKAARGTTLSRYPWGNDFSCSKANAIGCVGGTRPVGSYPDGASPYGAMDMAGNVAEWINDWYGPYPSSPVTNPTGPASGDNKVHRGGAFSSNPDLNITSFYRALPPIASGPNRTTSSIGFRCAQTKVP